jgi:hypothetical protein
MKKPKDEGIELGDAFWDRVIHPDAERLEGWRETWTKILGREQTLADAAEANRNFFGLLKVLARIDARRKSEERVRNLSSAEDERRP